MAGILRLQEQAQRAERLARSMLDKKTIDALLALALDYRTRAEDLRRAL